MNQDSESSGHFRGMGKDRGFGSKEAPFEFKQFIFIWENVVSFIAGVASKWGNIETGGELYGLWSHGGRPVIMAATPPGPNATHGVAGFTQDLEFVKRTNSVLLKTFGLQFLGNYHSHHFMELKKPSHVDKEAINSVARRNGYRYLCQFVITFERVPLIGSGRKDNCTSENGSTKSIAAPKTGECCCPRVFDRMRFYLGPSDHMLIIRVNSFFYEGAMDGDPVKCPMKIIRGTSPFSRAIKRNSGMPELGIRYSFPIHRIMFDHVEEREIASDKETELPFRIYEQCLRLPEEVLRKTRVFRKNGLIVLALPRNKGSVFVVYNQGPPQLVERVFFCAEEDPPVDISGRVLLYGHITHLQRIYEESVHVIEGQYLAKEPDKSGGVAAEAAHPRKGDGSTGQGGISKEKE